MGCQNFFVVRERELQAEWSNRADRDRCMHWVFGVD